MTTVADLAADKAARAEVTRAAAQKMKTLWPTRIQPWPKCRGTEGECNSGRPPGRDGFCSVCHKRVVTLIVRGYDVHPLSVLRVSYATYRAKTPQSAPKPNRKPMASRVFTDADLVTFPTPDEVKAAKAPATAPKPAPMFGPGWAQAAVTEAGQADRPWGKWQPLVDDGMKTLAAPASPMEPDYHRLVTDAHDALNMAGDTTHGDPSERIRAITTHYRDTIVGLQTVNAALRANLNNPAYLREQLARLDEKAARIAALKAELATLENE